MQQRLRGRSYSSLAPSRPSRTSDRIVQCRSGYAFRTRIGPQSDPRNHSHGCRKAQPFVSLIILTPHLLERFQRSRELAVTNEQKVADLKAQIDANRDL